MRKTTQQRLLFLVLTFVFVVVYDRISPPIASAPVEVKGEKIDDTAVVEKVIDGDTFKLASGETVRLIGVDTPETVHPTKEVQCFGKEASEYTKGLLLGRTVRLEQDVSDTDRYGRLLRYVYLTDGTFVNKKLVDDGYAKAATFPPDVLFTQDFLAAEKSAQTGQRGLWKACTTNVVSMNDAEKQYSAVLHTTAGDITIQFNKGATPKTVANFVTLAEKGFYDNTIFHRVIQGFMIQGGDPTGSGMGGPGYKFADEPFTGEYTRGTVAMANSGPNTNGSQFFIMHADVPLQKNYVIFGKVVAGLETVDRIATAPVEMSFSGEASTPVTAVSIKSVEVTAQ